MVWIVDKLEKSVVTTATSLSPMAEQPRRKSTRKTVAFTILACCASLQLWLSTRYLSIHDEEHPINIHVTPSDPADAFKDDIWPIRELEPWDISTDFPHGRTLEYEVEEGTWLRLDVHPKSGEIVFDMLGDIYCLPASAHLNSEVTAARPILRGIPHDSDPHFSPNGKQLVFRSDAGLGVENIWITSWSGCDDMNLMREQKDAAHREAFTFQATDDYELFSGKQETVDMKQRRLLREGRSAARRVTNETYRYISDARLHPSGDKIIATKWYTSSRSLGAGEGWEFTIPDEGATVKVGRGRRLLGRTLPPGWTAEQYEDIQVGPEQSIWRGNDSVIFSKNVIDKSVFTYSKDVHSGIYSIFSRNLTTNVTETLVSSFPGGASRPELSRDGKTLAFVRRVRDKEALVLKDLHTGTLHHIWHGLTYDLSTISAPMGTYPSFAFTPSDDAVIVWAAGKIWRVPITTNSLGEKVANGAPSVIKFRATIRKQIAETLHSDTDLLKLETSGEQRLHAFKDLRVNEDGSKVVFQGAGITYYQDLASQKTKAQKVPVLHSSQPYYAPSFVPGHDNLIIHARWSDTNFTTFELTDVNSGIAYDISSGVPIGRYRSPILCECAGQHRKIAFIKISSSDLSGNVVATAFPGLYIGEIELPSASSKKSGIEVKNLRYIPSDIDVEGRLTMKFFEGSAKLLVEQEDRAFVINIANGPNELGLYEHTTIAKGRMSGEIVVSNVSSKGFVAAAGHVAFIDFHNIYVLKANATDKSEPLWSKPGRATNGIARTSLDGGHDVQWSKDGKKLFWLLGPYLHELEVSKLSECQSEINKDNITFGISCTKKLLTVHDLHVYYETDIHRLSADAKSVATVQGKELANADVIALTNATVLTMVTGSLSKDFIDDAVIIVRGGIIESVGSAKDITVPTGATLIDAQGSFITPGFIDVHAHWSGMLDILPARSWELETFLAYGVTTLHNPSSDSVGGFVERARVENGFTVGPRIYHTGEIVYGGGEAFYHADVPNLEEARSTLLRIKVEGGPASFSYKNYQLSARSSRQRLLLAAKNLSMIGVPEGGMNLDWDLTYIIDGLTTIEHSMPVPVLYDDVLTLFAKSGTGYTPTHIVNYGGAWGEQIVWGHVDVPNDPKLRRFTRHDILELVTETTARPMNSFALFNTSSSAAKMVQKGLRVHIGAHGEPPLGLNFHSEMVFTGVGGLNNYEVLRAATLDAAVSLGIDNSLGSLNPGKLADLVVYKQGVDLLGGPMRTSLEIRYVMRGGRMWEADTMQEAWPMKGRRATMPKINAE